MRFGYPDSMIHPTPMGYELHITRAETWLDAEQSPITETEWQHIVAEDESLSVSATDHYSRRDAVVGVVRVPAVLWTGDAETVFWFDRGGVTAKNPADHTIVKMLELASRMNARVFGDDDEEYLRSSTSPGRITKRDPGDSTSARADAPHASMKPWWKIW